MSELAEKVCIPCRGGVPPLSAGESQALAAQIEGWSVVDNHHIEKELKFPNFITALRFVDAVGALAEEQRHHPEILLAWGRVLLRIWTNKIDGLTESDFVLAAKIDRIDRMAADTRPTD
jgi:4a-hydroxytetrahydrobiopterin dehydratase